MTKVLLLGYAPLPADNPSMISALNRRTWHLARALGEAGHDVLLLAVRPHGAYPDEVDLPAVVERTLEPGITYRAVRDRDFHSGPLVPRWFDEFAPQGIVAVGPRLARRVAELAVEAPLWVDLYGYLMGEAQAAAQVFDDDSHLAAWQSERVALERADMLSACSTRARYATIGELGAIGRLNKATAGHDLVSVLPSCVEPEPYEHTRDVIRGTLAAPDDFVVLFAGGYNTWTDVDTLFDGLTRAMRRNRHVRFVSTGGAIKGHDERTFARFQDLIAASPFADRFSFAGWVPAWEVPSYYLEADVGVNVDRFSYEALLGTRYRLTDMCKAGLPVVTTLGCELSVELRRAELGLTYRFGDAAGLAEALLRLAADADLRQAMARRAARYALENWHYRKALASLLTWAREPTHAPDFGRVTAPEPASAATAPSPPPGRFAGTVRIEDRAWTAGRVMRAVGRRLRRLVQRMAQPITVWGARAFLVHRALEADTTLPGDIERPLVVIGSDPESNEQALDLVQRMLPNAQATVYAVGATGAPRRRAGVRTVTPISDLGVRGTYVEARRLRSAAHDAVIVVGLRNRRAEALGWVAGVPVFALGGDDEICRSVVAPGSALRNALREAGAAARRLLSSAVLGDVMIGLGIADAIAAVARIGRRRAAK